MNFYVWEKGENWRRVQGAGTLAAIGGEAAGKTQVLFFTTIYALG